MENKIHVPNHQPVFIDESNQTMAGTEKMPCSAGVQAS
jgi:hypothetical protein